MSDGETVVPAIEVNERVARFILKQSHLRQDRTVKQDAFIPHPHTDLSVTRHLQLSETQLWQIGHDVARQTRKKLHGRTDLQVSVFQRHELRVVAAPLSDNRNHANVTGWPADKPAQKIIAQQVAAAAGKALEPPQSPV
jgi:hypothetical protein